MYECGNGDVKYPFNYEFTEESSSEFFNRLRFDRIMVMSMWPHFFGPPCRLPRQHTVNS